ncbi:MAG: hypothetical protein JWP37_1619 [Mucilaginibacter sp.]|nr:hypothetical protein [Mucilaginibacter sp.]
MKATLALPRCPKKVIDTALFPPAMAGRIEDIFSFLYNIDPSKSTKKPYFKFYKVLKNDTTVSEVSTNDFKPFEAAFQKIKTTCNLHSAESTAFSLWSDDGSFYGFLSRVIAMEHAKAGALAYIGKLIEEGEKSNDLLLKYREDHYDDLNFNLTDRNIKNIELALNR